jgi:hypothetical protein
MDTIHSLESPTLTIEEREGCSVHHYHF